MRWTSTLVLASFVGLLALPSVSLGEGVFRSSRIPSHVRAEMFNKSWRQGCPLDLKKLVLLEVSHFGFNGGVHTGHLIVHQELAREVLEIFREIYEAKFPIEKMKPIYFYDGDDDRSMADNNTSSFNCRTIPGRNIYSLHSYGQAIDINPKMNPVIKKNKIRPAEGESYVDRSLKEKGMIHTNSVVHQAFVKRGWTWGGAWKSLKDYHHFQKKIDRPRRPAQFSK